MNLHQKHCIKLLMFDITQHWESALQGIWRRAADDGCGHSGKWVVAAARINQRAIWQRYAEHFQVLADTMPLEHFRPASIKDTIRQTFKFEQDPLWDSPHNVRCTNFIQDNCMNQDRNLRANAPVRPIYGGNIPPKFQVEDGPTTYWKGMPIMFTTCDYNLDEISAGLKQKYSMGMPPNMLPKISPRWDSEFIWVISPDEADAR